MSLADFIASNRTRIVDEWKACAGDRLGVALEETELVDHLPDFLDDLVEALRAPSRAWPIESARKHGLERMRSGIDIGSLTVEIMLVGEIVAELLQHDRRDVGPEIPVLMGVLGRGAAVSVGTYAAMRDKQLADQAARHFSFIAHEIRNPLHNARLAERMLSSSPAKNHPVLLKTLRRSLSQLADLVDNSLVEARLYGDPVLQVQSVAAQQVADVAIENVHPQARLKDLTIVLDVEPVDVEADSKLLVSALTNLLTNAVKFTREGGRIVFRARSVDERVLFEVEDECGGLPEDALPRLFKPFVQSGADRSGFGLGLMIVKQAAESHRGTVRVENLAGKGCCFAIELPRRQRQES